MVLIVFLSLWSLHSYSENLQKPFETVMTRASGFKAFWMVEKDKSKVPSYKVPALEVMATPVTQKQYKSFLQKQSNWKKENVSQLFADESYLQKFNPNEYPDDPITYVSWFAARSFCQYYGYRLPTIAEWEFLAAANETKKDANSDSVFLERILNWYGQSQSDRIGKVKSKYKNMYGIWDMHGLIWEWVEDFNTNLVTGESREDSGLNRNLFCGAGALTMGNKEDYAAFMRFAFRSSLKGKSSIWNLGFRCVRDRGSN